MVREFVETILERLVRHMSHEWAAMLRRSRGELEHGSAVVWESGGCLVLVLVVVACVVVTSPEGRQRSGSTSLIWILAPRTHRVINSCDEA